MSQPERSNGHLPQDYHMHTNLSCDSQTTMALMSQQALEVGLTEIAFTEHFDIHPKDDCANFYRPDVFFERIAAARAEFEAQGLTIRAGVELGEPHRYAAEQQPVVADYPYDVVLGSLHWLGDNLMFNRDYFRTHSPEEAITPYFTELVEMIHAGGFDVLAHVDVFKRVAWEVYQSNFEVANWEEHFRTVWQACLDTGITVELNTASLRRGLPHPHPAEQALSWNKEMGGERLTMGSDAHRPEHIAYGFETGLAVARAAGFMRVCRFEQREIVEWIEL